MKALEKDRNRRYESASALAADMQRYLDDEPVQACPPSVGYRLGRILRRHRSRVTTAALLVLAILIFSGFWWKERSETFACAGSGVNTAPNGRATATDCGNPRAACPTAATAGNRAEGRGGPHRLRLPDAISHGRSALPRGRHLDEMLAAHLPQEGRPDLRGWEWYYLLSLAHSEVMTLRHERGLKAVAWSPDGRYLATAGDAGVVKVREGTTGAGATHPPRPYWQG